MYSLIEKLHFVKGLDPVADFMDSTQYSDIVDFSLHQEMLFVIYKGVGTTGTSTITMEASDDISGSNVSAIPFKYKAVTSTDLQGAVTTATSAGFTTTAGSSQIYVIEVIPEELSASGYKYVRLKAVESVNSPVLGGILVIAGAPKYGKPSTTLSIID
jgi:hypothetical protein